MVKKNNGKWQMCVDFIDLNKACPKDSLPLSHIDQLIDVTAGNELLRFLDAYSGYNQILMKEEDQEKITFITHQGTYCYMVMSFRLAKWAIELSEHDITYQPRMMIKSQALADFIADFRAMTMPEVEMENGSTSTKMHDQWVLYTDGASTRHDLD
uniref:RNA-directed DNA polymerase homolog n=1 Tax=Nicotiana tabacum TaxID=4097 RepID=A0A1S4A529_TOBAC|nr:PREDICTED: uncharacterized protein LOC107793774 [Nicotiana tabacum]